MYSPRKLSHLVSSKANQTTIHFFFFSLGNRVSFSWNSGELIISHLMGVTAESTLVRIDAVYCFFVPNSALWSFNEE